MTDLAEPTTALPKRTASWTGTLAGGVLGGAALGVAARAWMRLIAEDPKFTWAGTMFIVIGFTVFGVAQAVATIGRGRARRTSVRRATRIVGVVGLLPLFVAAGGVMLPTVVGGGFALARTGWPKPARAACLAVATVPVVFAASGIVGDFGWSLHTVAGVVLLLALYGTIVRVARSTFALPPDGRGLKRWVTIVGFVVVILPVAFMTVGMSSS